MSHWQLYLGIFVGGGVGAALRQGLREAVAMAAMPFTTSGPFIGYPFATFLANTIGSFAIGWLAFALPEGSRLTPFLITGILGGFTTMSTFSFETLALLKDGHFLLAAGYCLLTVSLCLLFCFLGSRMA
jgi:fluoride exporter